MANYFISVLTLTWITFHNVLCDNPLSTYDVVAGWKQIDYQFDSPQMRERLLESKEFIPENNIITGIKVYGGKIFLTVPRWRLGIPSTLNYINVKGTTGDDGSPLSAPLIPFPSLEMQQIGNCSCLQFVQSMEIDQFGRMWIIDVGRVNIFNQTGGALNNCPAKILIIDLNSDNYEIVHQFEFPPSVVSPTSNFLNDIVVACSDDDDKQKCIAYITDAKDAKLVIYNLKEDRSWFVHHKTMQADPDATQMQILDGNYTFNVNIDGIAISPKDQNFDRIYYCPLSSYELYSVSTSVLQEAINGMMLPDTEIVSHKPPRSSQADGLAMDSQGLLFYGLLQNNSVVYVNTSSGGGYLKEVLLVHSDVDLHWPDTFAFDDQGYLYTVSNRLQQYSTGSLDWTEVNFRVAKIFIGSRSYMYSTTDKVSTVTPDTLSASTSVSNLSPTNLDPGSPDQPVFVDTDVYKHHHGDDGDFRGDDNGVRGSTDSGDSHHHSHQHSDYGGVTENIGMDNSTSSAPTVNEQLPVVLFLSVLMYNPALRP